MKLAFVNFYSGFAQRGGETYVDKLAELLSEKHQVTLFQAGHEYKNKKYEVTEISVLYNPDHPHGNLSVRHPLKRLFLDYFHLKELFFTLKVLPRLIKLKPDIIFPQNAGWEVFLIKIISIFTNSKIIIAGQSGPGWNDRINLLFHPDVFVALTNNQQEWAKKATIWNDQKIVTIPNGVDTDIFSPIGDSYDPDLTKPIILAVGAAIKSKRIIETIKAVALLKDVSLLVAGTGPDEKDEDNLGQKLLGKRYKRLKVSHSDMPGVYRSANVFTLCSDSSEAFGIVYLEALATGLPCVVTDDPSRQEILGNTVIFVSDATKSEVYAEKLKEALKIKDNKNQLTQAEKYSWKKISEKYLLIIKSVSE